MEYSSKGGKKIKDSDNQNKKLDKFYTNEDIVLRVIEYVKQLFKSNNYDIGEFNFLEPCAGAGAFLNGLDKALPNCLYQSFDILPEDPRIKKGDFLTIAHHCDSKLISIGNPPFGYKGDLACSFINICSEWGPVVVFVLPIQFRRFNIQKHVYPNLKLIYSSEDLPRNSFNLEGKKYNVNCLFQIWVDKFSGLFPDYEDLRLLQPLPNKHDDFKLLIHNNTVETLKYFDKEKYGWDFAVARQGFYDYSHRITDPSELKQHVQYLFVKYINPISRSVFDRIDFDKLSHVNTAILGYSNTDVVAEYIKVKKELGF